MIKPGEIQAIANLQKVRDTQIEKDYIITWVLIGLSQNEYLREELLFKGGTALKKAYYPDYRFSEDLDFTFVGSTFDKDEILNAFEEAFEWIYDESRIKLTIKEVSELSTGNVNFYTGYIGPLGGDGSKKDLKVDISQDEKVYYAPEGRNIHAEYSDTEGDFMCKCYSLGEIISEKMRTLMERTTPRDLYDLWFLLEVDGFDIEDFIFGFQDKAAFKGLNPNDFVDKVSSKKKTLKSQWEKFLSHQINDLPDFEDVWRDFGKHLRRFSKFLEGG